MYERKKYLLHIGIDTGVETGIGIWNRVSARLETVRSVMIHQAMHNVLTLFQQHPSNIFVRVEDARLRKEGGLFSRDSAKLQGVGSVKRDAKIWEDFLIDHKIPHEMVHPRNNKTKLTSDAFAKITGWTDRTNSHSRDAAMLVFGM